jgi:hypothetical protein
MAKIYRAAQQGYAADGREGLLEAMLAEQLGQHAQDKVSAYKVARTLAFLDRTEPALTHLALAVAEREPDSLGIKIDSAFRSLHGNARFRGILAQAGHAMSFSGEAVELTVDGGQEGDRSASLRPHMSFSSGAVSSSRIGRSPRKWSWWLRTPYSRSDR